MFAKTLLIGSTAMCAVMSAPAYADDRISGEMAAAPTTIAEDPPLPQTAPPVAESDDQSNDIIVTASKRAESVQDVPISMNVVGSEQLARFNIANMPDLMQSVPSLFIMRTQTNFGLYLRGFGTSAVNPSSDSAVSVYLDGIWQEKSRQLMIDFFDVQRIEVLRGAQGALVGKNTEIGAISFITNDPTSVTEAGITANYNFDLKGIDTYGYISGPITDKLSARFAFKVMDQDGFIRNLAGNAREPSIRKYQGRLGLKFTPTDSVTNVFKAEYSHWDQIGNNQLAGDPTLSVLASLRAACCTKTDSGPLGRHLFDRQNGWRLSNRLDVDLAGGYTLTSLSGFNSFDSDSLGAGSARDPSGFGTEYIERYKGVSTELRLQSPTGPDRPFDFIAGVYVDYSDYDFDYAIDYSASASFLAGVPGSPGYGAQLPTDGGLTLFNTIKSTSYSAYITGTWRPFDGFRLVGAARYSRSIKDGDYLQVQRYGTRVRATAGIQPSSPLYNQPLYAGVISTRSGGDRSNFFDPAITAQYDVAPDVMVYASWQRGSKGAAFDVANRVIQVSNYVFKPEKSVNYEVGLKSKPVSWLTFNVTGFVTKLSNLQVSGFDPALNALVTRNAGKAESKGIELQVDIRPFKGLEITNSINYIDAKFTDFPGAACIGVTSPFYSGPTCTPATNNIAGVPLQFVPNWSGNTNINYTVPISNDLKIDFAGSVDWRSALWLAPTYALPYGREKGTAKLNLRLGIAKADDSWSLAIVARNVTNILTTNSSATFWGLETGKPAEIEIYPEAPRNIAIQGSIKF